MEERTIILHACPPLEVDKPSPSLTVLKSFLIQQNINAKIIYWNLIFENLKLDFLFDNPDNVGYAFSYSELLFLNYLAISDNDSLLYEKVKLILTSLNVPAAHGDSKFIGNHMYSFKIKVDELIHKTIEEHKFSEALCFGFSLKLDQWLFASILGNILKRLYTKKTIIVGGLNTKKTAVNILNNFKQFDIAVWGEGEYQLLEIINKIQSENLENISNIAFRRGDEILFSKENRRKYVNLSNSTYMDFSDYFTELENNSLPKIRVILPVERSRGCHWNKCHFCYLNIGYKYRIKSLTKLKNEILTYITEYEVYNFIFLDNDIIGPNLSLFDKLLDCFIEIKKIQPKFRIVAAEIITKGLNREIIAKMAIAGIASVQIGWESTSDQLLSKIKKKNTFTSNLFFLKIAIQSNIKVTGMNVIANLIEETERDILEAINNIKFLRFFRSDLYLHQTPSRLAINSTSRYVLKNKINDKHNYQPIRLMYKSVYNYVNNECAWDIFDMTEFYYRKNKYSYRLIYQENHVFFHEYINFKEINVIDILIDSIEYYILENTNSPITLEQLHSAIFTKYGHDFQLKEIINVLNDYFSKGLIYHNDDYSEIISVININEN